MKFYSSIYIYVCEYVCMYKFITTRKQNSFLLIFLTFIVMCGTIDSHICNM